MRKRFLRFYIGLFAVLSLTAIVFFLAILKEVETFEDQKAANLMKPLIHMIQEKMEESFGDPIALATLLEELNEQSILTFHIAKMNENYLHNRDIQRIYNAEVVGLSDKEYRSVFSLLPGGDVIHIGSIPLDRTTKSVYLAMLPPFMILILIGLVIYLLLRPIERQIIELSDAADRFGTGNFSSRAKIVGKGAMNELASVFNSMSDRIELLVTGQRELLHAVSHDLRTPLSRVFFNLDNALSAETMEEKDNELKKMDRSLVNLNDLVRELLEYIRLDEPQTPELKINVGLEPILIEIQEMVNDIKPEINLSVNCAHLEIYSSPKDLRRVLENLVTNALRHAQNKIIIDCSKEKEFIHLNVEDDGEGIPPEERDKVFKPFYRLDHSRNQKTGGSGLGLAIVSRIMGKHGGTISVSDNQLGGASFKLTFPIA